MHDEINHFVNLHDEINHFVNLHVHVHMKGVCGC